MRKNKAIFITATDTHAGKTVATFVLGVLLNAQGLKVGAMKPVQCGGNDAAFLKKALQLNDPMGDINPCYVKEPLSPHLAFRRAGRIVDSAVIRKSFQLLRRRYDVLLVEGAGGLMVPLKDNYYNADLIRELKTELIIVARLGLGTINHTILTINQAKAYGLRIKGLLFSDNGRKVKGMAEQTNPTEIERLSGIKVLGTIPYLKTKTTKEVLRLCRGIVLD